MKALRNAAVALGTAALMVGTPACSVAVSGAARPLAGDITVAPTETITGPATTTTTPVPTGTNAAPASEPVTGTPTTTSTTTAPAPAVRPTAMLIVSTHTDDEATGLALYSGPNYANIRKYFLWIDETMGGSNTSLLANGMPSRWNPCEWKPTWNITTDRARSDGKFQGSLSNLAYLSAKGDPNLPVMAFKTPTKKFARGDRTVSTWIDAKERGGGIRYDIPVDEVSPETVRDAINDVTRNPAKFGIPAGIKWTDIISSSFYNYSNVGGSTCDLYSNPQHKKVHDGVIKYQYPQFSGWKHFTVCQADSKKIRMKYLTANVKLYSHTAKGSLNVYFGWLYRNYGVPLMFGKSGVFSTATAYTVSPALAGAANP